MWLKLIWYAGNMLLVTYPNLLICASYDLPLEKRYQKFYMWLWKPHWTIVKFVTRFNNMWGLLYDSKYIVSTCSPSYTSQKSKNKWSWCKLHWITLKYKGFHMWACLKINVKYGIKQMRANLTNCIGMLVEADIITQLCYKFSSSSFMLLYKLLNLWCPEKKRKSLPTWDQTNYKLNI
jgi:hypothetical protein